MGIENGTTNFTLQQPISYTASGQKVESVHITLREPRMDILQDYIKMKDIAMGVLLDADNTKDLPAVATETKSLSDTTNTEWEEDIEGMEEGIKMMLSKAGKTGALVSAFADMCAKSTLCRVAIIDEAQPLNKVLWQNLSVDDSINMAIRYAVFFAIAPEMKRLTSVASSKGLMQAKEA